MGYGVFLFVLLISQAVFAQVQFSPGREITLTGKSCEELNVYAQSIVDWTASITKETSPLPECFCSSQSCKMDVLPISPYWVRELTNFKGGYSVDSAYPGPNCFNTALYFSNTLNNIVFTHAYEMTAVLNSSLCREIKAGEALQPGDILVVRDQTSPYLEIHAGVYISDDLSFSKYGESPMMSFSYGLNVQKAYGVHDPACLRVEGVPKPGDPCYNKPFANYFSCTANYSYVSDLSKQPGGIDERVREVYAKSSSFDHKISGIAFKGDNIKTEDLRQLQSDLKALYDTSGALMDDPTVGGRNQEFARLMYFHIYSLFEQTRRIASEQDLRDAKLKHP